MEEQNKSCCQPGGCNCQGESKLKKYSSRKVHHLSAWLAIVAISVSSFLIIMATVYAETDPSASQTQSSVLGKVGYWYGKVNQHLDAEGKWATDSDGVSGADIYPLEYCQKWYPAAKGFKDAGAQYIEGWKNRGNADNFNEKGVVYECLPVEGKELVTPLVAWGNGFPTWRHLSGQTNPCDLEKQMLVQGKPWFGPHCEENGNILPITKRQATPGQIIKTDTVATDVTLLERTKADAIKKNAVQLESKMAVLKNQVAAYKKKGAPLPPELGNAIVKIDELTTSLKVTTDASQAQWAIEDVKEYVQDVKEEAAKLPQYAELPKLVKHAESQLAKASKTYEADVVKAKKSGLDLAVLLGDFKAAIQSQQNLLSKIKGQVNSDPEAAYNRLTKTFYVQLTDMWQKEKAVALALNYKRNVNNLYNEIKKDERIVKKLEAQKLDTKELKDLLEERKVQYQEIKKMVSAKQEKSEVIVSAIGQIMATDSSFDVVAQTLSGKADYLPALTAVKSTVNVASVERLAEQLKAEIAPVAPAVK